MTLIEHRVDVDLGGGGSFGADGTVGALAGYTVGSLSGRTVGSLGASSGTGGIVGYGNVTRHALGEPGPTAERGRDQIAPDAPPLANGWTVALGNTSGLFSAGNVGSPYYGRVVIGRAMRWQILSGGTTYPVVHGLIKDRRPDTSIGRELVSLRALSQLAQLIDKRGYSSPLYGDGTTAGGVRTDVALGYVFDAAGLTDPALRAFDAGDVTLPWFWIRPEDELFELATRIWASEGAGARLYDDAEGVTHFLKASSEVTLSRMTTVQATFRDVDDGVAAWYSDWTPDSGESTMVNSCTIALVRRAVDASDAVIASMGGAIVLNPNETRDVEMRPTSGDPISSAVAPVAGPDYLFSAGALATAPSIVVGSGARAVVRLTADVAGATIVGPAGATAGGMQLRGRLARPTARLTITDDVAESAASILTYRQHQLTVPTQPELDETAARVIADAYVLRGLAPRPTAVIQVPLVTPINVAAALGRQIGDRVVVTNQREGFDRPMWVEAIKVEATDRGTVVSLVCETAYDAAVGLYDAGRYDVDRYGI